MEECKMKYVKCPRCDLNYMKEGEKYCDVCKAELKIGTIRFAALDDDEQEQLLCPICKRNLMDYGEEMCPECKEEAQNKAAIEPEAEVDPENDEGWRKFLDEDEKEAISNKGDNDEEMISLSKLEQEEADELFDDEEPEDDDEFYNDEVEDEEEEDDFPVGDEEDYDDDEDEEEEDDEDDL